MNIPKNEKIVEQYLDGKYITTRAVNGNYHLYEKKDNSYTRIKKRSSDPLFKETHPN